jgi:hypothetical protein
VGMCLQTWPTIRNLTHDLTITHQRFILKNVLGA